MTCTDKWHTHTHNGQTVLRTQKQPTANRALQVKRSKMLPAQPLPITYSLETESSLVTERRQEMNRPQIIFALGTRSWMSCSVTQVLGGLQTAH